LIELKLTLDPTVQRKFQKALDQLPLEVQDRVVKRAMRPFLNEEMKLIRARNGNRLPGRDLKAKIKTFRSGVTWAAIGYKTPIRSSKRDKGTTRGRAQRAVYDMDGTGWRSHFAELGFHTWSKSLPRPRDRHFLGWKRGLTHRGRGNWVRGTYASILAHRAMAPQFRKRLLDGLNIVLRARKFENPTIRTVEEIL